MFNYIFEPLSNLFPQEYEVETFLPEQRQILQRKLILITVQHNASHVRGLSMRRGTSACTDFA